MESGATIHCLDIGGRMINFKEGVPQAFYKLLVQFTPLCDDQCFAMHGVLPAITQSEYYLYDPWLDLSQQI